METVTFSQASLVTFATCRRRFQLRYLEQLSWPGLPLTPQQQTAIVQGQAFHQSIERFLLGLGEKAEALADDQLQLWWQRFRENMLPLPSGLVLPELQLTVPVGNHFLTGRFDLLIVRGEGAKTEIQVYDWKTSRPQTAKVLEETWQTKLYLALLAEGGDALLEKEDVVLADNISLTYWYVSAPQLPRTIKYSQEQHAQNWTEIELLVREIDACLQEELWPLTDNWSHCRSCAYWAYCGRFEAGLPEKQIAEAEIEYEIDPFQLIEPNSP